MWKLHFINFAVDPPGTNLQTVEGSYNSAVHVHVCIVLCWMRNHVIVFMFIIWWYNYKNSSTYISIENIAIRLNYVCSSLNFNKNFSIAANCIFGFDFCLFKDLPKTSRFHLDTGPHDGYYRRHLTACVRHRAPSQYKDRLIYVWRFPC